MSKLQQLFFWREEHSFILWEKLWNISHYSQMIQSILYDGWYSPTFIRDNADPCFVTVLTDLKTSHRLMILHNLFYRTLATTWQQTTPAPVWFTVTLYFHCACVFASLRQLLQPWHLQGCWAMRTSRLRSRLVKVSQTAHTDIHARTRKK